MLSTLPTRLFPRRGLAALISVVVLAQMPSCCCLLGGATTPPMTPFAIEPDLAAAMRERVIEVTSTTGPFEIVITDRELTSYLVGLAQSGAGEFPARDMKLAFSDGYVEIWATFVEIAPSDLPIYIKATVSAVDGKVVFFIVQAHAGPFPIPGAMRELISQSLGETLAELQFDLDVAQVEIRRGEMVLSGTVSGEIPDLPIYVVN
ncbi:MAG: hypothetical protein JW934_13330 [Anaerolineae bacterium]|nr:hypothetical protein [Anaerolineae bacterium]